MFKFNYYANAKCISFDVFALNLSIDLECVCDAVRFSIFPFSREFLIEKWIIVRMQNGNSYTHFIIISRIMTNDEIKLHLIIVLLNF